MRNKLLISALLSTAFLSWAAKDPVLMKINGSDVKLSEFEYLYHKNNQQQIERDPLNKYIDRFVVYKLKVADAKNEGIDTTLSFQKEFNGYRDDLAAPFLVDTTTVTRLAKESYGRMLKEVNVSHIMLPLGDGENSMKQNEIKLDSIKKCIESGQDFNELAKKYSIDPSVKRNNGNLGYITSGKLPYAFEYAAYNTPVGKVSNPFRTDFGVHIVKVLSQRPSRGEVLVEHILKLYPRGANDAVKAEKAAIMDSIYAVILSGADFENTAKAESDDQGSSKNGGKLAWFGSGAMVPEFDSIAFSLKNGELSKPFETMYGVHIIKKLNSRSIGSYEENKKTIINSINRDERALLPKEEKLQSLRKEYKLKENKKFLSMVNSEIEKIGGYDSTIVEAIEKMKCEAFSFSGKKVTAQELATSLNKKAKLVKTASLQYIKNVMKDFEDKCIIEYAKETLPLKHPEYANLLNEYKEGMMLFEVSNKKVWEKASLDQDGLEAYFKEHKANYKWDGQKFKGTIIYTTGDSLMGCIKEALKGINKDSLVYDLKKQFKANVRIEHLLVSKGENNVVDELVFNSEKRPVRDAKFGTYFVYEGKLINDPEEVADVKGQVTSDYQNLLEEQWVENLKNKYPVVINKEILKQIK